MLTFSFISRLREGSVKIKRTLSSKIKTKKPISFKVNTLALFLILVGVIGVTPTLYFKLSNNGTSNQGLPNYLVNAHQPVIKPLSIVSGYPVNLQIPSLKFNLTVIPGYYNKASGTWNLTLNEAQYATPSVPPNNYYGNTVIYGHYRPEVFAYLHLIQPNSMAYVITKNGYRFNYQYQSTYALNPSNTSVFSYKGSPILTLQTCSGAFFQNRQMFVFKFLGYDKLS